MVIGCFVIPLIVSAVLVSIFFMVTANATSELTVPENDVLLVRSAPDEFSPLLARFGQGRTLTITGRTDDWQWLEVELWDDQRGWALRPLDILPLRLEAPVTTPAVVDDMPPTPVIPLEEAMIAVPAATFSMGSPPGLGQDDESPVRVVSLSPFEIDRTEVTVGHYWECVLAKICDAPTNDTSQTEAHYLNDPAFDNHPIINIAWAEANRYCGWRGKRLPTEAEWEMAAGWDAERGAKLLWPWGNDPVRSQANVAATSAGEAAAVGTFPEDNSPVGALDMGGNVSEWVSDWYKVDYYSLADDTDPTGPSQRRGEGSGRVVRGAAFSDPLDQARTANRGHQEPDYGYRTVGFRCARDLN